MTPKLPLAILLSATALVSAPAVLAAPAPAARPAAARPAAAPAGAPALAKAYSNAEFGFTLRHPATHKVEAEQGIWWVEAPGGKGIATIETYAKPEWSLKRLWDEAHEPADPAEPIKVRRERFAPPAFDLEAEIQNPGGTSVKIVTFERCVETPKAIVRISAQMDVKDTAGQALARAIVATLARR